jgi:hypothetical protein
LEGAVLIFNIFIGLIFVFFTTNLYFLDIGSVFYATNLVGYLSIFAGIKELEKEYKKVSQIKPYVVFMIIHSSLFFILNSTGNSPGNIALTTSLGVITALTGLGIMIVGMFIIYYIIGLLLEAFRHETKEYLNFKNLYVLLNAMLLISFFACTSFIFNVIPILAESFMLILLVSKILFLLFFYTHLLKRNH